MPINVILQDERGKGIDKVVDVYGDVSWPTGDQSFPLLQYVNPYGNTIFNELQMPQILRELELMISCATHEDRDKALLERIRALAVRCRDNNHIYLRFVGD